MREKVYVSESPLGRGVFAKFHLEPREPIFYMNGKVIDFEMSKSFMGEYSVQIGNEVYVDPISPARYLNHSCEPNAGFVDDFSLIALAPIRPGDEIRFDYSTTMMERFWELDCSCGADTCRTKIRDFDLIPEDLQMLYLELGIVQQFIVYALNDSRRKVA